MAKHAEDLPLVQHVQVPKTKRREGKINSLQWALILTILVLVGVAVYLAYYRTSCIAEKRKDDEPCMTPACVELAGTILSAMNSSVDPCQDFYQYACGGWIQSHVLPDYLARLVTFTILEELNNGRLREKLAEGASSGSESQSKAIAKAKQYYSSCMNSSAADAVGRLPLDNVIKSLGGWTVQKGTFDASTWEMQEAFAKIGAAFSNTPFFVIDVIPDQKDTSRSLITLSQGRSLL